ncbi:MAG TPA: GNAT family protein [Acidimicrobiia bacterium]|nr:GNAT family protein [Acidimicrobiia bacterium]
MLSGKVVRLEPLSEAHVDGLAVAAGEDRTTYGWTPVPDGIDGTRAYVRAILAMQERGETIPFAQVRVADDAPVGVTRYLTLRPFAVEIGGTWLGASAQRTPINTEAKLLLLTNAFETWHLGRVDFKTDARNERSRNAIGRLGATFEGVLYNWQESHAAGEEGKLRDSAMFSITDAQWPSVKASLEARLCG